MSRVMRKRPTNRISYNSMEFTSGRSGILIKFCSFNIFKQITLCLLKGHIFLGFGNISEIIHSLY